MDFIRFLLILAMGGVGVFAFVFGLLVRNTYLPRIEILETTDRYGIRYGEVGFKSSDGLLLKGWSAIRNDSAPTIILLHGLGTNRSDVLVFVAFLYEAGWNCLVFDFRAHGESQGSATSFGYHEQKDLEGAIRYLDSRTDLVDHRYGVFGISMGAAVAILEAARNPKIQAVAVDSCFASLSSSMKRYMKLLYHLPQEPLGSLACWAWQVRFGALIENISPAREISKITPRPILMIHGEEDDRIPVSDARELYERAGQPKELWIVPGAGHLGSYDLNPVEYRERVVGFFKRSLPVRADRSPS